METEGLGALIGLTGGVGIVDQLWFIVQIVASLGIVIFLGWKFIIYPKSYKDIIEIWDITDAGVVRHIDEGRWLENKRDGTGYYTLLKDKLAKLKQPPLSCAIPDKKGRYKYLLVRNGESGFDYSVMTQHDWTKGNLPTTIPLSDTDWCKHSLKKASEKRVLSGFWNENKGAIMFTTAAVLTLILVYWTIGFAADTAGSITGAASAQSAALSEIAASLQSVANQIAGQANNVGVAPPPGF